MADEDAANSPSLTSDVTEDNEPANTPATDIDPADVDPDPDPSLEDGQSEEDGEETEGEKPAAEGEGDPAELQDVEYEGKTYKVPKAVAPGLMMRADYQKKTADVARKSEDLDLSRLSFDDVLKSHDAFRQESARLNVIDYQLGQLKAVDLEKYSDEHGLEAAQKLSWRIQNLEGIREKAAGELQVKHEQRVEKQAEEWNVEAGKTAAILEKPDAALGWPKGGITPPVKAKLERVGAAAGFTPQELGRVIDPRYFKVLHLAEIGLTVVEKQRKALKEGKPGATVKPVPASTLSGKRTPASSASLYSPNLSTEEFVKQRNAQIRNQNRKKVFRSGAI